jgi:hypothetical protein
MAEDAGRDMRSLSMPLFWCDNGHFIDHECTCPVRGYELTRVVLSDGQELLLDVFIACFGQIRP